MTIELLAEPFLNNLPLVARVGIGLEVLQTFVDDVTVPNRGQEPRLEWQRFGPKATADTRAYPRAGLTVTKMSAPSRLISNRVGLSLLRRTAVRSSSADVTA